MNKQRGNATVIVLLAVLVIMILGAFSLVGTYISMNNTAVKQRTQIDKLYKDSENKLSGYTLTIMDLVQVPKMYIKDFKETVTEGIKSRSANDQNVIMKFAQEHNINISDKLYIDIMAAMKAGRDEFKTAQSAIQEACAVHTAYVKSIPQQYFISAENSDLNALEKKCTVISDADTRDAFDTGLAKKIDISK